MLQLKQPTAVFPSLRLASKFELLEIRQFGEVLQEVPPVTMDSAQTMDPENLHNPPMPLRREFQGLVTLGGAARLLLLLHRFLLWSQSSLLFKLCDRLPATATESSQGHQLRYRLAPL